MVRFRSGSCWLPTSGAAGVSKFLPAALPVGRSARLSISSNPLLARSFLPVRRQWIIQSLLNAVASSMWRGGASGHRGRWRGLMPSRCSIRGGSVFQVALPSHLSGGGTFALLCGYLNSATKLFCAAARPVVGRVFTSEKFGRSYLLSMFGLTRLTFIRGGTGGLPFPPLTAAPPMAWWHQGDIQALATNARPVPPCHLCSCEV